MGERRGQAMLETALILPLVLFTIFAIIEGALAVFTVESANYGVQDAVKVLSAAGTDPGADQAALSALNATALGQTHLAHVDWVRIERLNQDGGAPTPPVEDYYTALDALVTSPDPEYPGAPSYPPSSRNVSVCCSDYIRVTVHFSFFYRSAIQAQGQGIGFTAAASGRLHPVVSKLQVTISQVTPETRDCASAVQCLAVDPALWSQPNPYQVTAGGTLSAATCPSGRPFFLMGRPGPAPSFTYAFNTAPGYDAVGPIQVSYSWVVTLADNSQAQVTDSTTGIPGGTGTITLYGPGGPTSQVQLPSVTVPLFGHPGPFQPSVAGLTISWADTTGSHTAASDTLYWRC